MRTVPHRNRTDATRAKHAQNFNFQNPGLFWAGEWGIIIHVSVGELCPEKLSHATLLFRAEGVSVRAKVRKIVGELAYGTCVSIPWYGFVHVS